MELTRWLVLGCLGLSLLAGCGANEAETEGTYLDAESAPASSDNLDQATKMGLDPEAAQNMGGSTESGTDR